MTVRHQFKNAIKRGTGQTHLLMKDNPNVDFSNEIIKAALTNLSYDNQSEGSRANYVFELIQLSNQKAKIRQEILKALATERKDYWALDQLFNITALFAKQGDTEAKKAIYKRFYKNIIQGSEWVGQDAILAVDGLDGLKYIAATKGKIIQNDPEEWEDNCTIDYFQEQNPRIKVYRELENESKSNEYIKIYLDTIRKNKIKYPKRIRPKYNYKIVSEKINSKAIVPLPPLFAKDLSKTDIKKLADDFLKETDRLKLEKYMRVFDRVEFPYDYKPLLTLAKSKNKKDDRLVEYATGALKYFMGSDIREYAIEKLKKIKIPSDYLDLLVSNYKEGDFKLLTEIVARCKNEHDIHSLVYGYVNIYEANKTKECKEPLEATYDKLTCGIHRADIIRILIENEVLSTRLKNEIKFDSYEKIRKLK
ncbi:MAG: hypothetical protein ABIO44_07305 [Saprospiraceae bacterium]